MAEDRFKVTRDVPEIEELKGTTPLSFYDTTNPDVTFFNLVDDEIIRLSGSLIHYYKAYVENQHDDLYLEAPNKVIASEPIQVYGHYEPSVVEEVLSNLGIEITNDQLFIFNKTYIEQSLGRIPKAGDVLKPDFQNQRYEIVEVQEESFEMYGVYHMACTAKIFRDDDIAYDERTLDRSDDVGGYLELE